MNLKYTFLFLTSFLYAETFYDPVVAYRTQSALPDGLLTLPVILDPISTQSLIKEIGKLKVKK